MSVEVMASRQGGTALKKSKSHKRKLADVSQSPVVVDDVQPSPTKKSKKKHELKSTTGFQTSLSTDAGTSTTTTLPNPSSTSNSPFSLRTLSLYLPLSPIAQSAAVAGLCAEHLSPLLLTYYAPLRGVVLSYRNPRLSESPESSDASSGSVLAVSIAEYGVSFVWLTADFLVLDPKPGTPLEGWVNLQSEGHVGLVCWNLFEATVKRERLPADWTWNGPSALDIRKTKRNRKDKLNDSEAAETNGDAMEVDGNEKTAEETVEESAEEEVDHGHYVDGDGQKVSGSLIFKVVELDAQGLIGDEAAGSFVTIRGTLLSDEAEQALQAEKEVEWGRRIAKRAGMAKKQTQLVMSGANPEEPQANGTAQHEITKHVAEEGVQAKRKKKDRKDKDKDGNKKKSKE